MRPTVLVAVLVLSGCARPSETDVAIAEIDYSFAVARGDGSESEARTRFLDLCRRRQLFGDGGCTDAADRASAPKPPSAHREPAMGDGAGAGSPNIGFDQKP